MVRPKLAVRGSIGLLFKRLKGSQYPFALYLRAKKKCFVSGSAPNKAVCSDKCVVRLSAGGVRGYASRRTSQTPNGRKGVRDGSDGTGIVSRRCELLICDGAKRNRDKSQWRWACIVGP